MFIDVLDLEHFYQSATGRRLAGRIRSALDQMRLSPKACPLTVGLGYTIPYMTEEPNPERPLEIAFMPAGQGVVHWPGNPQPQRVALVDEAHLPLPDASINELVMVHMFEFAHNPQTLLREAWRVLAEDGQLLIVIANRRGFWARSDSSPFGHGRPYSAEQLRETLVDAMFHPDSLMGALYTPPWFERSQFLCSLDWEGWGHRWWRRLAGVWVARATKRIYAIPPVRGVRVTPRWCPEGGLSD